MPTKRFSNTKVITRENIEKVPGDKPGVYRIKNAQGKILYIGTARCGQMGERIYEHRGRFLRGTKFQYITTARKEDVDQLEDQEIMRYILPGTRQK